MARETVHDKLVYWKSLSITHLPCLKICGRVDLKLSRIIAGMPSNSYFLYLPLPISFDLTFIKL